MTSEVAGMLSATINMNTVMASRLVITNVMRSPESGGKKKDNSVNATKKWNWDYIVMYPSDINSDTPHEYLWKRARGVQPSRVQVNLKSSTVSFFFFLLHLFGFSSI